MTKSTCHILFTFIVPRFYTTQRLSQSHEVAIIVILMDIILYIKLLWKTFV